MLLCCDIGNTNTVMGVVSDDRIEKHWRIRTDKHMTVDELAVWMESLFRTADLATEHITHAVIASVVPSLTSTFEALFANSFQIRPLVVGPQTDMGMPNLYDNPKEVGADRLVNAVAAYKKYQCALIVVDLGTATTFDYVSQEGSYIGGAIAAGLRISTEALFHNTSKLPRIEVFTHPKTAIARDTSGSMMVGAIYGHAGLIDGIVNRMKKESKDKITVVATGGLASLIHGVSETIEYVEKFLTLEGLAAVSQRNIR